jgi:hypothetical protein
VLAQSSDTSSGGGVASQAGHANIARSIGRVATPTYQNTGSAGLVAVFEQ